MTITVAWHNVHGTWQVLWYETQSVVQGRYYGMKYCLWHMTVTVAWNTVYGMKHCGIKHCLWDTLWYDTLPMVYDTTWYEALTRHTTPWHNIMWHMTNMEYLSLSIDSNTTLDFSALPLTQTSRTKSKVTLERLSVCMWLLLLANALTLVNCVMRQSCREVEAGHPYHLWNERTEASHDIFSVRQFLIKCHNRWGCSKSILHLRAKWQNGEDSCTGGGSHGQYCRTFLTKVYVIYIENYIYLQW